MRIPSLEDIAKSTKFRVGAAVLAGVAAYNIATDYAPTLTKRAEAAEAVTMADHYRKEGRKAYLKKDYNASLDNYRQFVAIQPESSAYGVMADCLLNLGRLDEAFDTVLKGLEIDPTESKHYQVLAMVHVGKGRISDAKKAINKALDLRKAKGLKTESYMDDYNRIMSLKE